MTSCSIDNPFFLDPLTKNNVKHFFLIKQIHCFLYSMNKSVVENDCERNCMIVKITMLKIHYKPPSF